MRKKEIKLPTTPITEETFMRQGWERHSVGDAYIEDDEDDTFFDEDADEDDEDYKEDGEIKEAFYYSLNLPKDRDDEYSFMLVSNATDELGLLKEMGLKPGQFFIEIADMDGLGFCSTEEELEVLYRALTGEDIE